MSDDEANSPATYERETQSQFVPREDDEEVLWEVIEITAEKPKAYKVRWAGVDPKTSKPWAQSWVEKRDCTDDLVLEWKRKQALKKKKEDEKKGNKRSSTKSRASAISRSAVSRGSTVSSSTTTKRSAQRESGSATTARLNKSRKRTHSVAVGDHDGDDLPPHVELAEDTATLLPLRPSKKRKLDAIRKRSHTTVAAASDSDEPPPALALPDELMPSQPPGPIEQRKVDLTEEFNAESSVEPSSSRLPPPGKRKTKVVWQADEDEDEDQVSRNTKLMSRDHSRPDKGKGKASDQDEDQQGEVVPVSLPPAKPAPPKSKQKPKANYPAVKQRIPLPSSPEPEPGYVKYKSGKVSTPRKRRQALSSVNRSSSSDDVEIGKLNRIRPPTRSPTPPSHSPVISQNGIAQLQAFDDDMIAISAAPVLPKQTENAQAGNSAPAVTVTTKVKRTTVVTRPPNGANSVSPDLYRQGIVPETETESSHNTQSQSLLESQSQSQSQPQARPQFLPASPSPPPVHVDHQRTADRSTSSPDLPPPIPRPRPITTHIPVIAPPHTPGPVPEPERRKQEIPLETPASSIHRKLSRVPTLVVPQPSASGQTPMRSSLISKMKPRTPGSHSHVSIFGDDIPGADLAFPGPGLDVHMEVDEEEEQNADIEDDEEKEIEAGVRNVEENGVVGGRRRSRTGSGAMRPLPQLSPSTFAPHLPSGSSAGGVERGAAMDSDEAEVEELVSSAEQIEQFSSPVKVDGKGRGNVAVSVKVDGAGRTWKTVRRNKQTRSMAKRRRPDLDEDLDTDKDTDTDQSVTDRDEERGEELEDLVRVRGEQLAELKRAEGLKRKHEFAGDVGEGRKRTLTELLGKRGRHMQDKERDWEKRRLRQGLEAPKVWKEKRKEKEKEKELEQRDEKEIELDVLMLRQEEEESTQDLMMDIEMRPMEEAEANTEWGAEAHVQAPEPEPEPEPELELQPQSQSSSQPQSQPPPPAEPHLTPAQVVEDREDRPRAKSKSTSIAGHSDQQHPPGHAHVLPATQAVVHTDAPDIALTLALLNEKSKENTKLTQEIEALRNALAAATATASSSEPELQHELEEARTSRDAALASLAESEKRVADLTQAKQNAVKETDFFREQYAKASGFVTSVREENNELEKQAQIAKDQATTGVEMIKATFTARVKTLEEDIKAWRQIATFMMEKDVRTNDDIRRRAAEEPELRAQCEALEEENQLMKAALHSLQDDLQDREMQAKNLELDAGRWKREISRLNLELSEVKARLETLSRNEEDMAAKGADMVYRCQWRPEGSNEACDGLFLNIEELQAHLYTGGHLRA